MSAQSRRGKLPFRAFEMDVVDGRWFWMTETVQRDGWMLCMHQALDECTTDVLLKEQLLGSFQRLADHMRNVEEP